MEYNIVDSINLCSNKKQEIKRKTNKLNKQFSNLLKRKKTIKKKITDEIEEYCKFTTKIINLLNIKKFTPNVHQILPLFLCIKDNKPGLLLNHYMGLGKTISGLLYSSYYKKTENREIIIILPEFLISTWKSEIKFKGFDINVDEILFIRYENFADDLNILYKKYNKYSKKNFNNNYVLIIDESHKLTYEFNKLKTNKNKKLEKYYDMLQGINKKILLTGTPIFESIYDLNYQINIVAGKDILPLNEINFDREFKKNSLIKSGLYGWLVPLLKITLPLQMLYSIAHTSMFVSSVRPMAESAQLAQDSYSVKSYYAPQNNNDNFIKNKQEINKREIDIVKNSNQYKYINKYFSAFGMTLSLAALSTPLGNFILILPLVLLLVTFVIGKLHDKYDLNKISHLNIKKISKLINPYCCYFKYKDLGIPIKNKKNICLSRKPPKSKDCNKLYLKLKNSSFPLFNFHVKKTYYTDYQTDLFIKLTLNRLNEDELKLLELSKDYHPKFFEQKISNQDFRKIGMSIGNLFMNANNINIFNEKIINLQNEIQQKIETYYNQDSKKNKNKINKLLDESNFYNELTLENLLLNKENKVNKKNKKFLDKIKIKNEYPEKFNEILRLSINRRTVIYSNFYKNGLEYFKKFLDETNLNKIYHKKPITYYYIDQNIKEDSFLLNNIINKFKNDEINFLLLCPKIVEGINIMKVQDFHLLEPLAEFNKIQQIFARVIRYNSHATLEPQKRYVNIYMWVTYTKNFLSNFSTKFKYWKKFDTSKIYWERIHEFDQDISPDAITYKMLKKQEKHIYELEKVLKENNIFNEYKYLFT